MKGIEGKTLNATVVGAQAGPVGCEVGISSLTNAAAIDNIEKKTTITLLGISISWSENKGGRLDGWYVDR